MAKKLHGNRAKLSPDQDRVPLFLTNTITSKKPTGPKESVRPIPENAPFAKCDVDENHK